MKRIKNEVNPRSFVSNFWGAPQKNRHSIILAASTLLKESNKNPLDIMKRKT